MYHCSVLYIVFIILSNLYQLSICKEESTVIVTIRGKLQLPQEQQQQTGKSNSLSNHINNSTLLTLNNAEKSTYSKEDGSFTFYNVKPGIYVLDVQSSTYHFSQIKIQVAEVDDETNIKCIEYMYPGSSKQAIPHPLVLEAHGSYMYFEPRQGFGFMSLLKNPMAIMMIASFGFMWVMPKMMENLDDEQKEQMQSQMEMQSDPTKMFNQLWGQLSGAEEEGGTSGDGKVARRGKRD